MRSPHAISEPALLRWCSTNWHPRSGRQSTRRLVGIDRKASIAMHQREAHKLKREDWKKFERKARKRGFKGKFRRESGLCFRITSGSSFELLIEHWKGRRMMLLIRWPYFARISTVCSWLILCCVFRRFEKNWKLWKRGLVMKKHVDFTLWSGLTKRWTNWIEPVRKPVVSVYGLP